MSSLALAIPQTAHAVISTNPEDLRTQRHDSRSVASKTLEYQFGFIIENYIANGKDRFKTYIEEHRRFCAEFIAKDEEKRGNSHKMKEIKVQHRVWTLLLHLSNSKTIKSSKRAHEDDYYFNPKAFIDDRFNGDYQLRKLEHVILWLQDIAPPTHFLQTGDISYSRTLNQPSNARHPSLKSLDPDVMTRMRINPNTLSKEEMDDLNDEERLLNVVFRLIRKGQWNKAVELCRNYGQHYRACSLNGRRLFCDKQSTSNEVEGIGGNEEYLMWLRVCNAICTNTLSSAEKWIYASCCGNVNELLTYVDSEYNDGNWYDLLWVLTVCKKVYVQHELLSNDLPSYYHNDMKNEALNKEATMLKSLHIVDRDWEERLRDFDSMFHWMEVTNYGFITKDVDGGDAADHNTNHQTQSTTTLMTKLFGFNTTQDQQYQEEEDENEDSDYFGSEYNYQYYKICKFIICERYEELLQSCWEFINNERLRRIKNGITLDFQRFIIHLYLHLNPHIASRGAGNKISQTFVDFILGYVDALISCHYYEQIARYCYILPKQQLIGKLSAFYLSLSDVSLRITLITKAKDVLPSEIINKITANIANEVIDQSITSIANEVDDVMEIQMMDMTDLHKIDSLTCLKIVNDNYNEILCRANQLFSMFAKQYKLDGIQALFDAISRTIEAQKPQNNARMMRELQCHLNSYECYELYKLVIDAYHTWNNYHENANIDEEDKMRNSQLLMQYVKNMLLYKNGWLNPRYCAIQKFSFEQINQLRAVVAHRLLILLYRFIEKAKQYDFALELTTIFANEKYSYYKLFEANKDVIRELLKKAKDAKIELIKYEQERYRQQQRI
eukprot:145782_1